MDIENGAERFLMEYDAIVNSVKLDYLRSKAGERSYYYVRTDQESTKEGLPVGKARQLELLKHLEQSDILVVGKYDAVNNRFKITVDKDQLIEAYNKSVENRPITDYVLSKKKDKYLRDVRYNIDRNDPDAVISVSLKNDAQKLMLEVNKEEVYLVHNFHSGVPLALFEYLFSDSYTPDSRLTKAFLIESKDFYYSKLGRLREYIEIALKNNDMRHCFFPVCKYNEMQFKPTVSIKTSRLNNWADNIELLT